MSKTVTLSDTSIASINLNEDNDTDGNVVGIVSMVSYRVHYENGKPITHNTSIKFTSGTDKEDQKMTKWHKEQAMANKRGENK